MEEEQRERAVGGVSEVRVPEYGAAAVGRGDYKHTLPRILSVQLRYDGVPQLRRQAGCR